VNPTRVLIAAAAALILAGCVSLLPKESPAQLYRFSANVPPAAAENPRGQVDVALSPIGFTSSAAGDRMLTVNGDEAAYIAQSRWIEPAQSLFEEAVGRAFESGAATRIAERRQSSASLLLDIDVDTFEARYLAGPNAAPTVVISMRARLSRYPGRTVVGEQTFRSEVAATDNRVSSIVPAYSAAVSAVLRDLVSWTDQRAAGAR
jgi:cholesterol transport system auxiliary component